MSSTLAQRAEERAVELDQMVRHLLEEDHRAIAAAEDHLAHHALAVLVEAAQHVVAPGVVGARDPQVVRVERLVDDARVGALRERVHQRRRDVARPRPQVDAQRAHRGGE